MLATRKLSLVSAAAVYLLLTLLPAQAEDAAKAHNDFFSRTASAETLASQRGGSLQEFSLISIEGALHHNEATNTVNGMNVITNGSFANANGMATAIQNSGNNVLIQTGTIIKIDWQ